MDVVEAGVLAYKLMHKHGLIEAGWDFNFDNAQRRFGRCVYSKKVITMSWKLIELNSEEEVRETILHEIAHALAGWEAAHGPAWVRVARAIGCNGKRCYGSAVKKPKAKWLLVCGTCGYKYYRFRKPRGNVACGKCTGMYNGGRYSEEYRLVLQEAE